MLSEQVDPFDKVLVKDTCRAPGLLERVGQVCLRRERWPNLLDAVETMIEIIETVFHFGDESTSDPSRNNRPDVMPDLSILTR